MSGAELKDILTALDESFASVARKLEMTPQNLDSILKTKDVKTGLIERLSKIYNKPISYFFNEERDSSVHTEGDYSPASRDGNVSVVVGDSVLAERVKSLEALLAEKERLIKVLMER